MKVHQKASTGNSLIKKYMDMYYIEPDNFEDFVYIGLMQGNGMEESVEAMRRGRPYCMGHSIGRLTTIGRWSLGRALIITTTGKHSTTGCVMCWHLSRWELNIRTIS